MDPGLHTINFKVWDVHNNSSETTLEFVVALQLPETFKPFKIWLFVGMTFIKAGYIVGEFMHLAHEKKTLMWTIMLPCVFVLWLIAALLIQADAIYNAIYY